MNHRETERGTLIMFNFMIFTLCIDSQFIHLQKITCLLERFRAHILRREQKRVSFVLVKSECTSLCSQGWYILFTSQESRLNFAQSRLWPRLQLDFLWVYVWHPLGKFFYTWNIREKSFEKKHVGFHHPARLFRRVRIDNCPGALLCFSKFCWTKGKLL